MKVAAEMVDPRSLRPWDQNPRVNSHAVSSIADAIRRFGFASPIVARQADRRVIAGHTRLLAALSLNLAEVPVRFMNLSESEASALALADNRLGELADWDEGILEEVLADLAETDLDISLLGFASEDVEVYCNPSPVPVGSPDGELVPRGPDHSRMVRNGKEVVSIGRFITGADRDRVRALSDQLDSLHGVEYGSDKFDEGRQDVGEWVLSILESAARSQWPRSTG